MAPASTPASGSPTDYDDFSVYKPVGHLVVSFPPAADIEAAATALTAAGFPDDDVVRFPPDRMSAQSEKDLKSAGPLASVGFEITLVRIRLSLAKEGFGFLVVRTPSDEKTREAVAIVVQHGARYAQQYGLLVIEEMLKPGPGGAHDHGGPEHGTAAEINDSEAAQRSDAAR